MFLGGENDSRQGWSKDTFLLNSTVNFKGLRSWPIKLCDLMKGPNY